MNKHKICLDLQVLTKLIDLNNSTHSSSYGYDYYNISNKYTMVFLSINWSMHTPPSPQALTFVLKASKGILRHILCYTTNYMPHIFMPIPSRYKVHCHIQLIKNVTKSSINASDFDLKH